MQLDCPFCGSRDTIEFAYLGDATVRRPDPAADDAAARFFEYAYLRDNPTGRHREYWYHGAGCRRWLVVERDTRTHAVFSCRFAEDGAGAAT
jgi:sarcosine oxidase subunit delta